MATILHGVLSGSDLHEPKGASTASPNTVYVFDGSGSGSVSPLTYTVSVSLADVSTASSVLVPIPFAGVVTKVVSVLGGVLTAADATLTVSNSAASNMGTITIAFTDSAEGDVDTLSPVGSNTVTDDDYIKITSDGASTGSVPSSLLVVVERS